MVYLIFINNFMKCIDPLKILELSLGVAVILVVVVAGGGLKHILPTNTPSKRS